MIKLKDSEITQILPEVLKSDPKIIAVSYAIHKQIEKIIEYSKRISVYASIDELPEEVIDLLAIELRSQYYKEDLELDRKRNIVKRTLLWYHRAGTPAAVQELVEAVFGEGKVTEWFDYGGDPYEFRVTTNATMTPGINEEFSTIIKQVKNARSHLEGILIEREINQTLYCGTTQYSKYKNEPITDGYNQSREATLELKPGVASFSTMKVPAITDGYSEQRDASGESYIGAKTFNKSKPAAIIDGFEMNAEAVEETSYIGSGISSHIRNQSIRE